MRPMPKRLGLSCSRWWPPARWTTNHWDQSKLRITIALVRDCYPREVASIDNSMRLQSSQESQELRTIVLCHASASIADQVDKAWDQRHMARRIRMEDHRCLNILKSRKLRGRSPPNQVRGEWLAFPRRMLWRNWPRMRGREWFQRLSRITTRHRRWFQTRRRSLSRREKGHRRWSRRLMRPCKDGSKRRMNMKRELMP